jgi:hypothetical protein
LLNRAHAIINGKPVPHTIDLHDGTPAWPVMLPLRKRPPAGTAGKPPHPFSIEQYLALPPLIRKLSAQRQAEIVTAMMRKKEGPQYKAVTRQVIRARQKEAASRRPSDQQ